ncbi:solute carrier family 22 member 17, partial [Rhincodon typus]|uniref:solute carrier family 22 member 17 n=1 Tax=Rhincodon typus TaxID=259920 RepID=UPI00202DFCE0
MGRRNTVILSLMASILFGTLVALSLNLPMFIFCRFVQGSAISGLLLSLYLIRLELCDPPHRLVVAMVTGFLVVGGQFLLLGLALASRKWRLLQAVITAPLGFFLVYCHILRLPGSWIDLDAMSPLNTDHSQQSICNGLWSRNIWKNIFILGFTTFIGHGIRHCYRIDQGKKSEFYLTYLLTAGTGALAILALCLTVDRFGRRGILLLAMTLTGLASLILLGLTEYLNNAAVMTFSILGLFSSHAVATLSVFFSAEVIPTVIRGEGLGLITALASVGQLSSPVSELHNQHGYFLHHVVYASLAVLCTLCIMLLPESKRKPLPETMRDGELYRRPSLLSHRRDHVPLLTAPNTPI